jgi:dihydrofolate synthase/folylpolyglutamate synthase
MTYEVALEKIHSLLTFGSRPGLDRILTLLDRMGNPQDKLKYIHVAGTNGKGSTCAMLSSVLIAAGYKTGLFISPYITDFRERIQINNAMISKSLLAYAVEKTFPLVEQLAEEGIIITEFEYVNALEFYIHSLEKCDVVVLETGMGGLLDCTNVIKPPLCSVITTIGLDHTAVLGDTIEKIAAQKCGIMKSGSIAVTSAQDTKAMQVIQQAATQKKIPLAKSESIKINIKSQSLNGSVFDYNGIEIHLPLAGDHQLENAKTALAAIEVLRLNNLLSITDEQIAQGFSKAVNPARLELLSQDPIVLLDGAHNPNGIEALKNAIKHFLPNRYIIGIMGMLADKDIDSSIKLLDNTINSIYTVPVNNPRALSPAKLTQKFANFCDEVRTFESAEHAFEVAYDEAKKIGAAIVICGSLYLAGEIRPYIQQILNK